MLLFKKRKTFASPVNILGTSGVESTLQLITQKCVQVQTRLADAMQKESERLSAAGKKLALAIYCIISISLSIYLITENFFYKINSRHILFSPISVSKHVFENDVINSVLLPDSEYNKIQLFTKYIDSLSRSISGERIKDSILKFRPFLMDSIHEIERIYQYQENNKK